MGENEKQPITPNDLENARLIGQLSEGMRNILGVLKELKDELRFGYTRTEDHKALELRVNRLESNPHRRFTLWFAGIAAIGGVGTAVTGIVVLLQHK